MRCTIFGMFAALCLAVAGAVLMFSPDPATAAGMLLLANAPAGIDLKALEAGMKEFGEKMGQFMEKQADKFNEFKERLQHVEQKMARRPGGFSFGGDVDNPISEITGLIVESDIYEACRKNPAVAGTFEIPHRLLKAAITNPAVTTTGNINVIVPADRRAGIVTPPMRRFAIRDILPSSPTTSGSVEIVKESTFTNNAQIQGVGSSPTESEGQVKGQSAMTFVLSSVNVPTIAHWVPASRQILSDSAMLMRYLEQRLVYGLKFEEEDQFLNGDGSGGAINGLVNQAQNFNGGVTNQTAIDTIAKAMQQLMMSDYMPTGVILNPRDWVSMMLAKDNDGNYILGNPQNMVEPRLWGLPVATTNAMDAGQFVVLDGTRAGWIADREDAVIRISESHEDFFVRNMVVILAEERSTLIVEQAGAIIAGSLSHAG